MPDEAPAYPHPKRASGMLSGLVRDGRFHIFGSIDEAPGPVPGGIRAASFLVATEPMGVGQRPPGSYSWRWPCPESQFQQETSCALRSSSLFAGGGGLSLGFVAAGADVVPGCRGQQSGRAATTGSTILTRWCSTRPIDDQ